MHEKPQKLGKLNLKRLSEVRRSIKSIVPIFNRNSSVEENKNAAAVNEDMSNIYGLKKGQESTIQISSK